MKLKSYIALTAAALIALSCSPLADADDIDVDDQTTRISFSPALAEFDSGGNTPGGESEINVIVTVNPKTKSSQRWSAEPDKEWCKMSEITVKTGSVTERGFRITVDPNTAYKRFAKIKVTSQDGTQTELEVVQTGVFPDAEVTVDRDAMEFNADNVVPVEVTFTTNMGDVYSVSADDEWLTWEDVGSNTIRFKASEWNDQETPRTTKAYITVGSEETSVAVAEIEVVQLARDIYCYLWGSSLFDHPTLDKAPRMTKKSEGVYSFVAYFASATTEEVRINNSNVAGVWPAYALDNKGSIVKLTGKGDPVPEGPAIDIDGLRTLAVDLNAMTYTLTRVTTPNCMPDAEAALVPTKAYVTKDGVTYKTWMTMNLNWNGGPGIGDIKLGSRLVTGVNTGGYGDVQPYGTRNPAYDEAENGGALQGNEALTDRHGRIYSLKEWLLGTPQGALSTGYNNVEWPSPYNVGDTFTDAVGTEITARACPASTLKAVTDDEAYYAGNPALSAQIQGICPYGWHVANYRDWYDLGYAALAASSAAGATDYPVDGSQLTIAGLVYVNGQNNNKIVEWLRSSQGWTATPRRAAGADEFGFNLYPSGWRLYKTGYNQLGVNAHQWVPLIGSTAKKTWRVNNITATSNFCMNDNLDAGNPAAPIRCVKNYKTGK